MTKLRLAVMGTPDYLAPEQACDAYVITGSAAGAYDDLPWIAPLSNFLTDVKGRAKLVGVCFGPQMMAQAFGGQVVKSPKGWGVGLHTYRITTKEPWMDSAAPIAIAVSHQDQVVALPPGAAAERARQTPAGAEKIPMP